MTARTRKEVAEQRRRICQVPCTHCGQPAGEPCRGPAGGVAVPHGKRRADAAAAEVWVPGEKVQAT